MINFKNERKVVAVCDGLSREFMGWRITWMVSSRLFESIRESYWNEMTDTQSVGGMTWKKLEAEILAGMN